MTIVYILFALSMIANALQFIAPRTKTTLDDRGLELVEGAIKLLQTHADEAKAAPAPVA